MAVSLFLGAVGAAIALDAFSAFSLASLADRISAGELVSNAELAGADLLAGVSSVAMLVTYVTAGVLFMVWTAAVVHNAGVLDRTRSGSGRGAAFVWLVPLLNFIVAAGTLVAVDRTAWPDDRRPWTGVLVWSWSAVFAGGCLFLLYARTVTASNVGVMAVDLDAYAWGMRMQGWAQVVLVVAAGLGVAVVLRISRRQRAAFAVRRMPAR